VADFVKCNCPNCGAKYRLPVEFQGRKARCKKCGKRFAVPRVKSLEDSVLDWLSEADEKEEETVAQPRVISIPKESAESAESGPRRKGPIRLKSPSGSGGE
jgi:tRNA(Ile2) C34 agmatinyltransferase TiaS